MNDIIKLLPDSVANQIAAGEVIQRPASAVKELIENAVDAESSSIKLIVKDAGKTLIQVIDNGKGMSESDARMCFERHATSKIIKSEDLFSIQTKGFRGEALASIAAIGRVELKTRRAIDELGTQITMQGSECVGQESCSAPVGTSISIKNLFYNVPARRNFLKSNPVETSHIIEEFQRVAFAHPEIEFTMHHNGADVFNLPKSNLRQRIVNLNGSNYNQRIVPIEEETFIVKIKGFIGKPEFAKKTRGEQYFFVNNRFIRNNYLHHAVLSAYDQLIARENHPSYFLFLEVDPKSIDINIHPTKTEIKFEDEKAIYAIIRSSVKKSLGQNNLAPSIDFEIEAGLSMDFTQSDKLAQAPKIRINPDYNPFQTASKASNSNSYSFESDKKKSAFDNWQKLYEQVDVRKSEEATHDTSHQEIINPAWEGDFSEVSKNSFFQLHGRYILSHIKSGFSIIDQQSAHERILYERFVLHLKNQKSTTQQLLFPETIDFSNSDAVLVSMLMDDLNKVGFDMEEFGKNTFVVNGMPPILGSSDCRKSLEKILEQYKKNESELTSSKMDNLARSLAFNASIKHGKILGNDEMRVLVDELFACDQPYFSPSGRPIITTFSLEDLEKKFKK